MFDSQGLSQYFQMWNYSSAMGLPFKLFICRISLLRSYKIQYVACTSRIQLLFCAEQVYDTMGHFLIDTARRARDFWSTSRIYKVIKCTSVFAQEVDGGGSEGML
jgi:hypothetical protein